MNSRSSLIKVNSEANLHALLSVVSNDGVHGLRIKDQKVQYYSKSELAWKDLLPQDIQISPNAYNALKKLPNGYYVEGFKISNKADNALIKKYDGYYVQKEKNVAHTSDINTINNRIDTEVYNINESLNTISSKLLELSGDLTKVKEYIYDDNTSEMTLVADISTLISPTDYVILNVRILAVNESNNNTAEIMTEEHGIQTMLVELDKSDVQQYDLGNANALKVYANGHVKIYIRITYI